MRADDDRDRIADAQLDQNSASSGESRMPSALLAARRTFLRCGPKVAGDVVILGRQPGAQVHDEDHHVGLWPTGA
jgi:hypothetical protein